MNDTDRLLTAQRKLEDLSRAYAMRIRRQHPEDFHVNTDAPTPDECIREHAFVRLGRTGVFCVLVLVSLFGFMVYVASAMRGAQ